MIRLIAVLLTLAAPGHAQTACTGLPDALAALAARYAEAPRVSGLMANGQLMIITASASRARSSVRAVMVIVPELLILAPRLIPASQRRSGDHMSRKG